MSYIAPEVVREVKKMDLLTYLKNYEPYELKHFSGNIYTTRIHDRLKISNISCITGLYNLLKNRLYSS